ncbi:hypothetical protein H8356DRAFT_1287885 [Neocallimastix lanati (nom. inval.)]|uniref:Uncharacterized protein n=1 Tax=Neocallimastix californiae TaxID=1754190 RepID=A0A1Y2FV59_9FUNG|nr:hypothetical protein H8356DRAFT_1287885 [Neocallimastix sp. JGI-2020a]ORY87184.1 hypothetical protein LY90DRAFT_498430 [Neocallimastix californiae]|eukprot:ORY87184.1 hypothetical protein LY90DRAFT_498430 [Neocallimastix californiae]
MYMDATHTYILDINDNEISISVIKFYNPANHDIKLYYKDENNIEVVDLTTNKTVWNYPMVNYTMIASNTAINHLRPEQTLILDDGKAVNQFCLKIEGSQLLNVESGPINYGSNSNKIDIEYLSVKENEAFIYFENGTMINLAENNNNLESKIQDTKEIKTSSGTSTSELKDTKKGKTSDENIDLNQGSEKEKKRECLQY